MKLHKCPKIYIIIMFTVRVEYTCCIYYLVLPRATFSNMVALSHIQCQTVHTCKTLDMSHPANKYRPVVLFAGPTTAFLHILYLAMPVIPCLHNAICKLIMMRLENQLLIATLFTVAPSAVFTLAIIDQCNEECTPNVSSSLHTVYVNKDDACYFTCDYYQFFSQASLSRSICVKI